MKLVSRSKKSRRHAVFITVLTVFVILTQRSYATEKPNLSVFPETNIILSAGNSPKESLNGLEKNADERAYPASIVKVLTALVAIDEGNMDDLVTISAHAVKLSSANAKIGVKAGEVYRLLDLIYGMLLPSGCDAARAVAEHIAGSEEQFAELMNEKARELGMNNSHFTNASGLHDDDMYTTARDLAVLGAAASENNALCEILTTKTYSIKEMTKGRVINVRNIDRLVNEPKPGEYEKVSALYTWCIGGKTGSTNAAGRTYMAMARYSGVTLVCVLLGDKVPTTGIKGTAYDKIIANRFLEAKALFEYGYNYLFPLINVRTLKTEGLPVEFPAAVQKGDETCIVPTIVEDMDAVVCMYLPARLALQSNDGITARISLTVATAPVHAGDHAGEVSYYYEEKLLFTLPLIFEYGLTLDPSPSPAPILQVEKRPLKPVEGTAAPILEINTENIPAETQRRPEVLWFIIPALLAIGGLFMLALIRRKK